MSASQTSPFFSNIKSWAFLTFFIAQLMQPIILNEIVKNNICFGCNNFITKRHLMTIRRTDVLTKSNCQAIFTRPLHFFSMQTLVYRIQIKTTLQKLHRLMDALKGLLYIYIEAKPFLSFFLSIHYFTSFQQLQKLHTTFFCQGNRSCLLLCRYYIRTYT